MLTDTTHHGISHPKLEYFIQTRNVPHIIFHGLPGTGKRTILQEFLNRIYGSHVIHMKTHIMVVNCSHGKGIKFIREELKFFARQNFVSNADVPFKSIVLLNADSLTTDAQSALRRCIEIFSHNTRFFVLLENKTKLLNPILSRFCEIYVPENIDHEGRGVNYHRRHLQEVFAPALTIQENQRRQDWDHLLGKGLSLGNNGSRPGCLVDIATQWYDKGYAALDVVEWCQDQRPDVALIYVKLKQDMRCEKMLIFYLLYCLIQYPAIADGRLDPALQNLFLV